MRNPFAIPHTAMKAEIKASAVVVEVFNQHPSAVIVDDGARPWSKTVVVT